MEYTNEFKERDELLEQLAANGLTIPNGAIALDFLTRVGYFRSGAYRYVFRKFLAPEDSDDGLRQYRSDEYVEGASLDHVMKLEAFDSKLARVCLEGLLDFEVRLRAAVAHTLARKDVAAHLKRECLDSRRCDESTGKDETKLEAWARTCQSAIRDAKQDEDFVAHHLAKYPEQEVPIWAVTEIVSFGKLPYLLDLMTSEDARAVAQTFGFAHPRPLKTAVRALVDLRNVCAHGSRLFNRAFNRRLSIRRIRDGWHPARSLDGRVVHGDAERRRAALHLGSRPRLHAAITQQWHEVAPDVQNPSGQVGLVVLHA